MERLDRRALFGVWATSVVSIASACEGRGVSVVQTPEGPVYQLERDEMLVLVSGIKAEYKAGDRIELNVMLNNQSTRFASARIRTRLLGRGGQAVAEAEAVSLNVKPSDASSVERVLALPRDLVPAEYDVQVELPPWSFEGRQAGGGSVKVTTKVSAP